MKRKPPKPSVIKRLVALSGNECAFPDCSINLVEEEAFIGELAHIYAAEPNGPRFDIKMNDEDRRDFPNLMLMCPTHHTLVDKKTLLHKYSPEVLKKFKKSHERKMKDNKFKVSETVFDEIFDELTVAQINILQSGNQANIQNVYNNASQFTDAAKTVLESAEDVTGSDADSEEDKLGLADKIAVTEEVIPKWTETILKISQEIESLTPILRSGTSDIEKSDSMGKGMGGRIKVFKKVAKELDGPSTRIEKLGETFYSQLESVDEGIISMIDMLSNDTSDNSEVAKKEFVESITALAESADEGLGALSELLDSMKPLETASKDLRKTLKKMRAGLTKMHEGKDIMNEWVELLYELG